MSTELQDQVVKQVNSATPMNSKGCTETEQTVDYSQLQYTLKSCNSSVGIALGYGLDEWVF
jgi:hypothetical protein